MLDERFVILGFAIQLIGGLSYLFAVIKGRVKPNRVTWFLWTVVPLIAFAAELDEGVGLQSLLTLSVGLNPLLIFLASFLNKRSYWELHRFDYLFGGLAATGLVLWRITGEGNLAIFFSILADGLAAVPTIVKSYHHPETESSLIFGLGVVNAAITLLTIDNWNFANYGFPIYILGICALLFALIQFRLGKRLPKRNLNPLDNLTI